MGQHCLKNDQDNLQLIMARKKYKNSSKLVIILFMKS